jgi:hypothetical protein
MRRIVKALPLVAAVVLCLPAAASAAGTFSSTVKVGKAKVKSGTVTQSGTFKSNRGSGKALLVSKGGNGSFESTATLTFSNGTLVLKGHSSTTGAADPAKYTLRGSWKVAGGTGSFKHASGKLTALGTGINDLSSTTFTLKGPLKP